LCYSWTSKKQKNKEAGTLKLIELFVANLLPISVALAIFEIWLEGYKVGPWGRTEFKHPFWEKKITGGKNRFASFLIQRVLDKPYINVYHIIMFVGIIPLISVLNYGDLWYVSGHDWSLHGWLIMEIDGAKIFAPIFLVAVWVGNMVVEDFLWFAIQTLTGWREPMALRRLFQGDFAWHKNWVQIGKIFIPTSYLTGIAITGALLAAQNLLVIWFK
jgi:hypothetical protein